MAHSDYSEIEPGLFLGNAASPKLINKPPGATYCLTFGQRDTGTPRWADGYLFCSLDDRADVPRVDMMRVLDAGVEFIKRHKAHGVLVHCGLGVSRSASCVILYVMRSRGIRFKEALDIVVAKRPCVKPNAGL